MFSDENLLSTKFFLCLCLSLWVWLVLCCHLARNSLGAKRKAHWTAQISWIVLPICVTAAEADVHFFFFYSDKYTSSLDHQQITFLRVDWCTTLHTSSPSCSLHKWVDFRTELNRSMKRILLKIMETFCSAFLHRLSTRLLFDCW